MQGSCGTRTSTDDVIKTAAIPAMPKYLFVLFHPVVKSGSKFQINNVKLILGDQRRVSIGSKILKTGVHFSYAH